MSSGYYEIAPSLPSEDCKHLGSQPVSRMNFSRWVEQFHLANCFIVILSVAIIDTWFAVVNDNIIAGEKNPICLWLLRLDPDSCSCFIGGKVLGALIVLSTLLILLRMKYQYARLVTTVVALFQLGLLMYLCLSDPQLDGWINFNALFDQTESSIFNHFLGPDLTEPIILD